MKYHATKVQRTQFRKLPFGARFWLNSDTLASTEPHLKYDYTTKLSGWNADGTPATTAVTLTAPLIRVPPVFLVQKSAVV